MRKKALPNYNTKEVAVQLNNTMAAVLRPQGHVIQEYRLRKLREYAQALLEPFNELIDGGVDPEEGPFQPCLNAHELVAILVSTALFVQLTRVSNKVKLPNSDLAEYLLDKDKD